MFQVEQPEAAEVSSLKRATPASKETLEALAPKCRHGISCVETGCCGDHPMCEIEQTIADTVLFIKEDGSALLCPYKIGFGFGFFCACPVRGRLYRKETGR